MCVRESQSSSDNEGKNHSSHLPQTSPLSLSLSLSVDWEDWQQRWKLKVNYTINVVVAQPST